MTVTADYEYTHLDPMAIKQSMNVLHVCIHIDAQVHLHNCPIHIMTCSHKPTTKRTHK